MRATSFLSRTGKRKKHHSTDTTSGSDTSRDQPQPSSSSYADEHTDAPSAASADVPGTDTAPANNPDGENTNIVSTLMDKAKAVLEWWNRSRLGRTLARYSHMRGGLLAGGIAYTGLFSVFAGLAIGISILMATVGSHPQIKGAVLESINNLLPGVVDNGSGNGLVSIDQLTLDSALNLGSVIGFLTLLYSAMGFMGALKNGVRAMFGIITLPQNPAIAQLINFLSFIVIMVAVLATALASVLTGTLASSLDFLPAWLSGWGVRLGSLVLSFVIDAGVFALMIRLAGPRVPRRDMLLGAVLGGLIFGVLRQVGTSAVGSVSRNPMLASFAAIVVLVLWLHLASRVVLYLSAWMANPPRPHVIDHPDEVHAGETPNYVTMSVPDTLAWPRQSLTGAVEVDSTAHPDYVPPVPTQDLADEVGSKKGLKARFVARRYRRAQKKADAALAHYREL